MPAPTNEIMVCQAKDFRGLEPLAMGLRVMPPCTSLLVIAVIFLFQNYQSSLSLEASILQPSRNLPRGMNDNLGKYFLSLSSLPVYAQCINYLVVA